MKSKALTQNHGGPLHYLGNRFLTLPNLLGNMLPDNSWLEELFTIISYNHKQKYKRCIEPFSGSASFSFAAMEFELAEEYIINDSDDILINALQLIGDNPELIKTTYLRYTQAYETASSKKEFFLNTIQEYNQATHADTKSALLPFIINHSWGGIIIHDCHANLLYREGPLFEGKNTHRYLQKANLSTSQFIAELNRLSRLINKNKVTFKSGDFIETLTDVKAGDFVALNPPYPENERCPLEKIGMYIELYTPEILHQKLLQAMVRMEENGIDYYMTYGFYNPNFHPFVLRDNQGKPKNYYRLLGYDGCAFGVGLDQMYFSEKFSIPPELSARLIPARTILTRSAMPIEELLEQYRSTSALVLSS